MVKYQQRKRKIAIFVELVWDNYDNKPRESKLGCSDKRAASTRTAKMAKSVVDGSIAKLTASFEPKSVDADGEIMSILK